MLSLIIGNAVLFSTNIRRIFSSTSGGSPGNTFLFLLAHFRFLRGKGGVVGFLFDSVGMTTLEPGVYEFVRFRSPGPQRLSSSEETSLNLKVLASVLIRLVQQWFPAFSDRHSLLVSGLSALIVGGLIFYL
jgi:hypothetical protein